RRTTHTGPALDVSTRLIVRLILRRPRQPRASGLQREPKAHTRPAGTGRSRARVRHRLASDPVADQRPNILLVMADTLTAQALSAYGNRVAQTPAIDVLSTEGVVFESAYCNSPLCAPSRASLVTGRLPSAIGVYDNASELPASVPTIAHYLRLHGY